jgi:site-specific DNA-cytosine methylase
VLFVSVAIFASLQVLQRFGQRKLHLGRFQPDTPADLTKCPSPHRIPNNPPTVELPMSNNTSATKETVVTPQRSASPGVMAYYNENDKFAAAWLRELIKAGHIAQGEVDERDVRDVRPNDLRGYTQHHFFAGIGLWSYSLRLAGWPDDRAVWTGSCPCQPFSSGGKRKGAADDRDLWWAWYHLIAECRPPVVFGEEVADAIDFGWLETLQDDMEGIGYATWAHCLAACNLGAPHQRERLFFVADSGKGQGHEDARRRGENGGAEGGLGNSQHNGFNGIPELGSKENEGGLLEPQGSGLVVGTVGNTHRERPQGGMESRAATKGKLADQVLLVIRGGPWPTPIAGDHKGQKRKKGKGKASMLCAIALLVDSGPTQNGSGSKTKRKGQLNPALARWLMGVPVSWDEAAIRAHRLMSMPRRKQGRRESRVTETALSRKPRKRSSGRT